MEKLLFIISAAALWAVSPIAEGRYQFVDQQKTWADAQRYCRENFADLATVSTVEEAEMVKNMVLLRNKLAWIGLYSDYNYWTWSSDQHGGPEFRNWLSGDPNSPFYTAVCVIMFDNGKWADALCEDRLKPICSDVNGQNVSFVYVNKSMSWPEAQSYCRKNHTDLATVRNLAENQKIQEMIPAGEAVWIGLTRLWWRWSDGTNATFQYWRSGEPNFQNQDCVTADNSYSGYWLNEDCLTTAAFICNQDPPRSKQFVKVRLVSGSSNPAVLEEIMEKLKQRLKDKGVNADINLSWRKQAGGSVFHKDED